MSALLFALTVVASLVSIFAALDARKARLRAELARWAAEDHANRAQWAANVGARWQD